MTCFSAILAHVVDSTGYYYNFSVNCIQGTIIQIAHKTPAHLTCHAVIRYPYYECNTVLQAKETFIIFLKMLSWDVGRCHWML